VESELFGHTRGAFTTAVAARAGLFEAANGGTLFLDEIGDLPLSAQVKLLRTLQSGEVKPVGSDNVKIVDVRVVAATNVDIKAAIAAGTFRQDLFYRLNVIAIRLPSLRERGDDILLLAHHFLQKHAKLAGRPATHLSHEAAVLLQRYDWPGNVRELEHAVEHAVVLSEGQEILPRALPVEVQQVESAASARHAPAPFAPATRAAETDGFDPPSTRVMPPAGPPTTMDALVQQHGLAAMGYPDAKKRVLAEFNDAYVGALLRSTNGNMSVAARRSGLDRSNFRRLVRTTSVDVGAASTRNPASLAERPADDDPDDDAST
jgi:DNA-binding NtrC family response regulator